MSTAIPTMMTHKERHDVLDAALECDDALAELVRLEARFLAELAARRTTLTTRRERLLRCVVTGTSPTAPEQLALGVDVAPTAAAPVAPATTEPAGEDGHPEPEPPKGKGKKSGSRKPSSATAGEKRAEKKSSGRLAAARSAIHGEAPADWKAAFAPSSAVAQADVLPAPGVPCCTCTHSIVDHDNGEGACLRCECRGFTGQPEDLPGAPGWQVRPAPGLRPERARILMGEGKETLPLWWVPKYGLAFQDGKAVNSVFSYLGMRATTLAYEKNKHWNWVPREVLRALAEHLGATWPEKVELSSEDTTPCECDGCGHDFPASELQPLGPEDARGYYCAGCKAEQEEQDGPAEASLDDKLRDAENRQKNTGDEVPAPTWAKKLDASVLLDAMKGPRNPALEWKDTLEVSGTRSACQVCEDSSLEGHGPTRARLDFSRYHRPKGGKSWRPDKDPRAGGILFSRYLCRDCATPEKLTAEREARNAPPRDERPLSEGCTATHPTTGEQCVYVAGHQSGWHHGPFGEGGVAGKRWKNTEYAYQGPPAKGSRKKKDSPTTELALEPPSPAAPAESSSRETATTEPGTWRVELPEKHTGTVMHILLVWLVNDATGERKAAQWWPSLGKLKCSHHRAGALRGKAQEEHLALMGWWAANRDEVVAPLEAKCAAGKVPGLKVYAPELLAPGPHRYALTAPWMVEVWESSAEGPARARFTRPAERSDMAWASGDFTLKDGMLTTADVPSVEWVADHLFVVQEAESFVSRGLVPELLGASS